MQIYQLTFIGRQSTLSFFFKIHTTLHIQLSSNTCGYLVIPPQYFKGYYPIFNYAGTIVKNQLIINVTEAREMSQWLRVITGLAGLEYDSQNTHRKSQSGFNSSCKGSNTILSPAQAPACVCTDTCIYAYTQDKWINISFWTPVLFFWSTELYLNPRVYFLHYHKSYNKNFSFFKSLIILVVQFLRLLLPTLKQNPAGVSLGTTLNLQIDLESILILIIYNSIVLDVRYHSFLSFGIP